MIKFDIKNLMQNIHREIVLFEYQDKREKQWTMLLNGHNPR